MKTILSFLILLAMTVGASAQGTMDLVKKADAVSCIVNIDLPGLSSPGPQKTGNMTGMTIDFCQAIAAAVLGDPKKYKTVPVGAKEQMAVLLGLNGDVMLRTFQHTLHREDTWAVKIPNDFFHDEQVLVARKSAKIKSLKDLENVTVCIQQGSLTELTTANWFRKNKLKYNSVVFGTADQNLDAFLAGRCDVFTADRLIVKAEFLKAANTDQFETLPWSISRTVYGTVVRKDDPEWEMQIKWIMNALIYAEEFGITQANVESMKESQDPNVRRLLGIEGDYHKFLKLDKDWAVRAIKAVGNYGEIYNRHLGPTTPVKLERTLNKLCTDGGRLCPVPMN